MSKQIDIPSTVKQILVLHTRMRSSGVDPSWENFLKQGEQRGMELETMQAKEFEKLWRILHTICPDPQKDRCRADYLLVYLAWKKQPSFTPNPAAFSLDPTETEFIHSTVNAHA